jgi:hypothetical protein
LRRILSHLFLELCVTMSGLSNHHRGHDKDEK